MRVAALYDIHGNLPALDAVLEAVEKERADLIVVGGDVVWGPLPSETIERLRSLGDGVAFIRGNADREVAARAGESESLVSDVADVNLWCADQLTDEQLHFLRDLHETLELDVDGLGATLFCHGSPRSDEENLTPATPERRFRTILNGVSQRVVVCGHTHMQFDRMVSGVRVVNAGSVGMPYEGVPGAYWALLGSGVELRRTTYDVQAAARTILASSCPHAREMFADGLVNPTTREEATAAFEPHED